MENNKELEKINKSESMSKLIASHVKDTISNKNRLMYANKYHKMKRKNNPESLSNFKRIINLDEYQPNHRELTASKILEPQ